MRRQLSPIYRMVLALVCLFALTLPVLAASQAWEANTQAHRDYMWFQAYDRWVNLFGDRPDLGPMLREKRAEYRDKYLLHTYDYTRSPWITPEIREAWIQGHTGKGVVIEIRDDWKGRYHDRHGRSLYLPSHGEQVELIISGGRLGLTPFVGIAPDATIIRSEKAVGTYRDDVDIVNESDSASGYYTIDSPDYLTDQQAWWDAYWAPYIGWPMYENRLFAHNQRLLILKSAGDLHNRTCLPGDICTTSSIYYLWETDHAENTLLVGGILNGNHMGGKAGVTRDYYLVDQMFYTLCWNETEGEKEKRCIVLSGASSAVPTATAKAALIRSKFPEKNGAQIAVLMKRSARDVGAQGVDDIWGWGAVDLLKALSQGEAPFEAEAPAQE